MRVSSLRTLSLTVSVLFAIVIVGGIAVTSYVIISDGMQVVGLDATSQFANAAAATIHAATSDIVNEPPVRSAPASERAGIANALLVSRLPLLLSEVGAGQASYTLYDSELRMLWSSRPAQVATSETQARRTALAGGSASRTILPGAGLLAGMFGTALLDRAVVHTPVALPGGGRGVLDVVYEPKTEQQVIDAVRIPMAALALSATVIMVVLMQTSLSWVLSLVENLRRATDSIEAGRFDERLPEAGDNEVGQLARSINKLIDRLQRRASAQSRFVADASHELATPVAGIRGYTSILRAWGAEDEKVREEAVEAIDRESRRMARLTGDLLNLLHADQGLVLKSERFDLNVLVRRRIAGTASRWIDKEIEFVGPDEDTPLIMVGDSDRVEDIISILLDNASKYTPPGGTVSASTRRKRDILIVEVADTGVGIPADDLPHVFDRFYRSEASRAAGEGGFGLGLAIAQSIIHSMGGEILAASEIGRGTTFTVILPRGHV